MPFGSVGKGQLDEGGQKVQTSIYRISTGAVTHSTVTAVNSAVRCTGELFGEQILRALITREKNSFPFFCIFLRWWMLTKLIVATISQHMQVKSLYSAPDTQCCVSITAQQNRTKKGPFCHEMKTIMNSRSQT